MPWLFLWLIYGCEKKSDYTIDAISYSPDRFHIEGKRFHSPAEHPPKIIAHPGMVSIAAGKPDSLPLLERERLRVRRTVGISESDPVDIYIGEENFPVPAALSFEPLRVPAMLPEITQSKDPLMKTANPFSFYFFTRTQSMPHDDISSFFFDKSGNMWITTYGAGIVRFDGNFFFHYTTENGLPDNFIITGTEDNQGRLLFGSRNGGLIIFDGFHFLVKNSENGLPTNRIETIFKDSRGDIWLGTFGSGVILLRDDSFYFFDPEMGFPANTVYAIQEDKDGNVWFGSRNDGLIRYNGESFRVFDTSNGLIDNFIPTLLFDHRGHLWMGSDGKGVSRFNGTSFIHYVMYPESLATEITAIFEDNDNHIWFGTRNAGLLRFTGNELIRYGENEGLINNFITHIQSDRTNNLWFGTYGGGIGLYKGDFFRHYTESEGFTHPFVRTFAEDANGDLWIGSNTGGAFIYKNEYLLQYLPRHGLQDHRVRGLFSDKDGNLIIGFLYNGLSVFDGENFSTFADHPVLSDISVVSFIEGEDGTLWLGTHGDGLIHIKDKLIIQYTSETGLSNNYIRKILPDNEGRIWIATRDGGLTLMEGPDRFLQFTEKQGFPLNEVFDILIDRNGALWIATNGAGLFRYQEDQFEQFTEKQGLGSNFVYSILEDRDGQIWVGTRWGLSLFMEASVGTEISDRHTRHVENAHKAGLYFKNFAHNDGFMGIGVNSRAMYQDKEGYIWVGANDVVTRVNVNAIPQDTIPPVVYMTWLGLFNEQVQWPELLHSQDSVFSLANGVILKDFSFNGVSPWNGIPSDLALSHSNNYIVFSYSAVAGSLRNELRFQYYLEGFDNSWGSLTMRTEAHFGNLSPGKYIFKLRALNSSGVFSEELHFAFKILPPWWKTWWAFALYLLMFASVSFFAIFMYHETRKIKEKRRQGELRVQHELELAKKSAEFKQSFLANMSHEIRTPLTGILGMADMLAKTPLNETQEDYLKTLIHSGKNLRETINMVLDYSKIEAGRIKLKESFFSMEKLMEDGRNYFNSINRKDIELTTYIDPAVPEFLKSDYNRIQQIFNNLISNAVKFTEKGKIEFKAYLEKPADEDKKECMIAISVCDTGKGIEEEEQKGLFKPFYQVEQSYSRSYDGTGLGLAICRELTMMLGGKISVDSAQGKGSTFTFTFLATIEDELMAEPEEFIDAHNENPVVGLNILLVEDKIVNQKVVSLILKSMGQKVVVAENGKEALEVFPTGVFDLILMDIQMPVMDGITATQTLRKEFTNLPPIVGLSANAFEGDREKYMSMGMDEYLTKPIREEDVVKVIRKLGLKMQAQP